MVWLVKNVFSERCFRQDQLLVVGVSRSGKTTMIQALFKALGLKVFYAYDEDFSLYNDEIYDLIYLDEFDYQKLSRSFLLKLLDGSNLRYTGKYQEVKSSNKLIIVCLNKEAFPPKTSDWAAFYKRVEVIEYNEEKKYKSFPYIDNQKLKNTLLNLGKDLNLFQIKNNNIII